MANVTLNPLARISLCCALLLPLHGNAETNNPHVINNNGDNSDCTSCHVNPVNHTEVSPLETKNKAVNPDDFKTDGVDMCDDCHNPEDGHKIGLKLDFDIPPDMPLNKKNALSCLTCHYTHGKLDSDRPQASFSVMDRIMDAERLHKSFLLRRNNVDGELCLICHSSEQGKK